MESIESMKEHYNSNLKAVEYNKKFNRILHLIPGNFHFILQFLHDVTQSERFKGSKVLEIGSGATVHNIAALSSKFSTIVQSDYVLDNVNELKRWHAGTSTLDWSQFLDIVLRLEGKDKYIEKSRRELEGRIRNSVKSVVRGDLLSDSVLSEDELTPETTPPFDVIVSVLCLETVAKDFDGYVAILKRLNKLLRQGGGILICGYENGSPWQIGESVFHHVKLTLKQITDAVEKSGFGNCVAKTLPKSESEYAYDYENVFCLAADKL